MSTDDDINALLGLDPAEIVKQSKTVKHELASAVSIDNLEERIISETNNIMDSTKAALDAVLDEVQSTPNDAELIESASSLIKAQTGLIDALNKLHIAKEKNKIQMTVTKMHMETAQTMNTENNQTKLLVSREEIMSRLMNDAKNVEVINV